MNHRPFQGDFLILDTQIISYCYSGHWKPEKAKSAEISAVTAAEFLLFHTRENGNVDYYVINPERYGSGHSTSLISAYSEYAGNLKWAKMGARRTDSIIIDFSSEFQPYRIFGNYSITSIINERNIEAFKLSTSHLDKGRQKNLKKKIEFIFDNNIFCHSLNEKCCDIALELFFKFKKNITPKDNIKNTVNDLLILSTAVDRKMPILTMDKVLGRFAAQEYSGEILTDSEVITIDFSIEEDSKHSRNRESKGYINWGWSYSFRKGNL